MKYKTFEEYMGNIHAQNYAGTDDDMQDSFDKFMQDLQVDEWLQYGDEYGEYCKIEGQADGLNRAIDIIKN